MDLRTPCGTPKQRSSKNRSAVDANSKWTTQVWTILKMNDTGKDDTQITVDETGMDNI